MKGPRIVSDLEDSHLSVETCTTTCTLTSITKICAAVLSLILVTNGALLHEGELSKIWITVGRPLRDTQTRVYFWIKKFYGHRLFASVHSKVEKKYFGHF